MNKKLFIVSMFIYFIVAPQVVVSGEPDKKPYDHSTAPTVVQTNLSAVQLCYDEELRIRPKTKGKISVDWLIEQGGIVSSGRILDNTTKSDSLGACLMKSSMSWKFSEPAKGTMATVNYKFRFDPKKKKVQ